MWPSKRAKSRHFGYRLFHGRNGSEARTEQVGRQPSLRFPGRDSSATFMGIRLTSGCVIFCNQPKMRSYRIPSPAATGTGMGHFPPIIRPVNQPIPERTGIARGPNHRGDPNPAKVFKHPANAPNALQIYAGRRRSVNLWISRTRMDAISGQDS